MTIGKCGSCTLERELDEVTQQCGVCDQRARVVPVPDTAVVAPLGAQPEVQPLAPAETQGPHIVAALSVTLRSDGDMSITGPLHDRDLVLKLLNAAHDLSYEYDQRRRAAAQAAAEEASKPAPKRFTPAWWRAEFAKKRTKRQLELAANDTPQALQARVLKEASKELARRDAAQRSTDKVS